MSLGAGRAKGWCYFGEGGLSRRYLGRNMLGVGSKGAAGQPGWGGASLGRGSLLKGRGQVLEQPPVWCPGTHRLGWLTGTQEMRGMARQILAEPVGLGEGGGVQGSCGPRLGWRGDS